MRNYLLLLLAFAFACGNSSKSKKTEQKDLPNSIGNVDDIVIVVDSSQWSKNTELGRELRKIFTAPVVGLPQDEQIFNIKIRKATELAGLSKNVPNIVFVNTLDCKSVQCSEIRTYFSQQALKKIRNNPSKFMSLRKDLFAKNQNVMFLFSSSADTLAKRLKENEAKILGIFNKRIEEQTKKALFGKSKSKLSKAIEQKHSFSMKIPFGFERARDFENFIWLRKLNGEKEQSIFVYYEPYKNKNAFLKMGEFRDDITKRFLKDGEHPDVHIARQDIIDVLTKKEDLNGHFAMQGRGLWKVSDSSRGGPYVAYVVLDEKTNLVYYIEGYVDSPGTKKKELMRELEAVLSTFKPKGDLKKS